MGSDQITWLIAAGGWIFAIFEYYLGYRERREQREDEVLAQTLGYFDGGTQRRSIGISLVEGIWARRKKQLDVIVPVLINQTIYLLLSSDSKDAVHEERNLVRLLHLLDLCIPVASTPTEHQSEILDAILRACCSKTKLGIQLPDATLKSWYQRLEGDLKQLEAEARV